jgi:hypothetical protein
LRSPAVPNGMSGLFKRPMGSYLIVTIA